jgi:hypothetical protein
MTNISSVNSQDQWQFIHHKLVTLFLSADYNLQPYKYYTCK